MANINAKLNELIEEEKAIIQLWRALHSGIKDDLGAIWEDRNKSAVNGLVKEIMKAKPKLMNEKDIVHVNKLIRLLNIENQRINKKWMKKVEYGFNILAGLFHKKIVEEEENIRLISLRGTGIMIKTSIVVSMYNKKPGVIETIDRMFIPSVLNNGSKDKEIVIVDDCSPLEKETKEMILKHMPALKSRFGNVVFSRNPKNLGFGASYNRGISLASGERLLITNDDVYLPLGSVNALVSTLDENPSYGLIGPISNPNNMFTYQYCKQSPKINAYSNEEFQKIESFSKFARNLMAGRRINADVITGFCFAVKASLIREMGSFDEYFKFGYYEDTDFAKRVSQKYAIIINPEVFVYHGGVKGVSGSAMQHPIKSLISVMVNGYKYGKKWGHFTAFKHSINGFLRLTGKKTVSVLFKEMMQ